MESPIEICSGGDQIFDIAFHPTADLLAVASITGLVEVFKYGNRNHLVVQEKLFESSCRGLSFSDDGEKLYSISSDRSWKCVDGTGTVVSQCLDAHDFPINKVMLTDANVIATGDDAGHVKLWDVRSQNVVMSWSLHEDFVSGLCYTPHNMTLLSVGGDSTLCVYDLRKQSNTSRSDDQEAELHCVDIIKGGSKVVCGTQDGVILIFSWDKWGDCSDRYPGHPETVDAMLKLDENTILTGSSDGLIRVVELQPNKVLGVIGDHNNFPVEGIKLSCDRNFLASFSHDEIVRFWNVAMLREDDDNDTDEMAPSGLRRSGGVFPIEMEQGNDQVGGEEGSDEWEDLSEGCGAEDMEASDSEKDAPRRGAVGKIQTATEFFFADL